MLEKILVVINVYGWLVATVLGIIVRFTKNKKVCVSICFLQIPVCITYLLITDDGWGRKIYSILVLLSTIVAFWEYRKEVEKVMKGNNERELVLNKEENISFCIDEKEHFNKSLAEAERGELMGMYNVAACYHLGTGTTGNYKKALYWANKLKNSEDLFWSNEGDKLVKEIKESFTENIKGSIEDIIDKME